MNDLPRLAVFHSENSAPLFELVAAASDLCRIVWVIGWSPDKPTPRILSRFGDVVDIADLDEAQSASRLMDLHPDGIVVFNDAPISLAASVAESLGLAFHSPHTARLLTDKLAQRGALREAGLAAPAFAPVEPLNYDAHVPYPAVLKPRSGAGGRDTFFIRSDAELADALATCRRDEQFILEEWLPDRTLEPGLAADVVSVESVVRLGTAEHIAVTGRFPFSPPFRETGSFLPSDLGPDDRDAVTALAGAAAEALDVRHGLFHTEIKMTPTGPRLVEVNGRLGGGISGLISRVGGPSLVRWAMQLALGRDVGPVPALANSPIAFFRMIVAPTTATSLVSMDGVKELSSLDGVEDVQMNLRPGDPVDARHSSYLENALMISGAVESHDALSALVRERIESTLQLSWDFA
jgi:biotin carboxylase